MNPIQHILDEFQLIVLDGAMATELERHGHDLNDSLWSAKILHEHPSRSSVYIEIILRLGQTVRLLRAIRLPLKAMLNGA